MVRLSHHQARASSVVGTAPRFLYRCISCLTLSDIESVSLCSAAPQSSTDISGIKMITNTVIG